MLLVRVGWDYLFSKKIVLLGGLGGMTRNGIRFFCVLNVTQ